MRCGPATFAVLALLVGLPPATAKERSAPKLRCEVYPSVQPLRVCTQLDESAFSRLGQRTTWRIVIDSGGKPVQVRLHNSSPEVLQLTGGNDQTVHMGCPRHKEVLRTVVSVGPGVPHLEARLRNPSPEHESSTIAAELAPLLARIEAEFIDRRDKLPPDYPAPAVKELLDSTEAELLGALSYQELAALRDYVQEKFRQARNELEVARRANKTDDFQPVSTPRLMLASFSLVHSAQPSPVDRILGTLRRLYELTSKNDLIMNLCVTSKPEEGAQFWMRPQSYRIRRETGTNGEIRGLYRGLYIFGVHKGIRTRMECLDVENCGGINLVDDSSPIFQCDLSSKTYKRLSGALPPGVCRGN